MCAWSTQEADLITCDPAGMQLLQHKRHDAASWFGFWHVVNDNAGLLPPRQAHSAEVNRGDSEGLDAPPRRRVAVCRGRPSGTPKPAGVRERQLDLIAIPRYRSLGDSTGTKLHQYVSCRSLIEGVADVLRPYR